MQYAWWLTSYKINKNVFREYKILSGDFISCKTQSFAEQFV